MKSTLKIAFANQGNLGKPVIKIVQPIECIDVSPDECYVSDDDSRDHLIRNLLQSPQNPFLNEWFQVDTRFPIEKDGSMTHYITTIAAPDEYDLFKKFKYSIINRVIPYEDIVKINRGEIPVDKHDGADATKTERITISSEKHVKIELFFQWLKEIGRATWAEQQPDGSQLK